MTQLCRLSKSVGTSTYLCDQGGNCELVVQGTTIVGQPPV